jgi:hypothetical protein
MGNPTKNILRLTVLTAVLTTMSTAISGDVPPVKDLPQPEKALANSVDPWGLAFADQLDRFLSYFQDAPEAEFVAGFTHNLVKIWPTKYWFRGEVIGKSTSKAMKALWGVTGSTVSFQVAALPKLGAAACRYRLEVLSPVPAVIHRQEFIKAGACPYVRFQSDCWPDPLLPDNTGEAGGTNLAAFLVEIAIPSDFQGDSLVCNVNLSNDKGQTISFPVPIKVVRLEIKPKNWPVVAWFNQGTLTDAQWRGMYDLALAHHVQPLSSAFLKGLWSPESPEKFRKFIEYALGKGQTLFQIEEPSEAFYHYLKEQKWLPHFIVYSNVDEPAEKTFLTQNIPYTEKLRNKFPGLRIFLASEYFSRMDEGCDILLTDLSSSKYDPRTFAIPPKPELWHYYCHLPIHFQMREPLTLAPNMLIDNSALEHRLALWMSWHYGARGVFIFAGNAGWNQLGKDFWQTREVVNEVYQYPYGGVHHGNGMLVYPPRKADCAVLPSLRLKILRDGIEDVAIFEAVKRKYGQKFDKLLTPIPEVFRHPHYFDQSPNALLHKREEILKAVAAVN